MLLAFVHITEREPSLCLIADRPDQFSRAVPVDSLPITDCAVCRLSEYETVRAEQTEDGWVLITPVDPTPLYLTPRQKDIPGLSVKRVRLRVTNDGGYQTEFQQDKHEARNEWAVWNPNDQGKK